MPETPISPSPSPPTTSGRSPWRWRPPVFAVVASWWENLFVFLSIPVCLTALMLSIVLDDNQFLYGIARAAQTVLCSAGNLLLLCRAPEVVWHPATSLLIIVNTTLLISLVVCAAAMIGRHRRKVIVFRNRREHKFVALIMLAFCLLFVWGFPLYRYQSFVGAIGMAFLSVSAVDMMRYALASFLTPALPTPQREKIRHGWFGPPLRRAQFAPSVETGEGTVKKDK